jgi:hypothetical protein
VIKYENVNIKGIEQRLWNKIVHETSDEQIESNWGSYLYLYPFGDLTQRSFHGSFHVPIHQGIFLKNFLITNKP